MEIGAGSPEGRVDGPKGTQYWDDFGKAQWIKETEEGTKFGWYPQYDPNEET
jgi:hypothetical protein